MEQSGMGDPRNIQGCGRGESCLRAGHLSPARILLRQLMAQRDKLADATAVLLEAVRASGGGSWEAPLGLTKKARADWLAEQEVRVGELKERLEGKQGNLVRQ